MNNKWFKLGTIALAVATVALVALGSAAYAQGPTGNTPAPMYGHGGGMMGMGGMSIGGPQNSPVSVAAKALGIEQTALAAELNTGKTLAQIAEAKGVALNTIADAFVAVRIENINAAVAAGRLTQAQADVMIASIQANALNELNGMFTSHGYSNGSGFTDANGDGVCDNCGTQPTQQPQFQQFGRGRWNH